MSERYSRLYALPGNLYAAGSPVVIAAGALLKDNQTGGVLAQLKLKNISDRKIKAVTVSISAFDTFEAPLGEAVSYQYLDMNAARDAEFGAKKPIFLPDATTRKFSAAVTSVAFSDNSVWKAQDAPWEPLPAQEALETVLEDPQLVRQYQIKYGKDSAYMPVKHKDLWYCACGALNRQEEATCHSCGAALADLRALDLDALRAERDARLAAAAKKALEEKAAAEARERERRAAAEARAKAEKAAAEARAKKAKKIAVIVAASVATLAAVTVAVALLVTKVIIPNVKYNNAVKLMDAEQYEEAIAAFEAMDGYKDSFAQIEVCNTAILDGKYNDAVALMKAGQYEEAITAFKALNGHKDSAAQIEACNIGILDGKYNDAVALMEAGQYEEAIAAFEAMDGYKDSVEQIAECERLKLKNAQVGDYVFWGTYEQDNDTSSGKEDIEWLVLEVKDGKALLISKYALDCKRYNTSRTDITWETCTLRSWLNNEFLNAAFSVEEQAMIPTVTVSADQNPQYDTNPGRATQDQVFLLSIAEVNRYFTSDTARQCKPTEYAVAHGAHVSSNGNCWWWLRSPGYDQDSAACVVNDSDVNVSGRLVNGGLDAVRPALWIDLDS